MYWQDAETPDTSEQLVNEYRRTLAAAYQAITDLLAVKSATETAAQNANTQAAAAEEAARRTLAAIQGCINASQMATDAANATYAAIDQCTTATSAAQGVVGTAQAAAASASQSGLLAQNAATLANQKAVYAAGQGDYAKEQGDYAKAQGEATQAVLAELLDNYSTIIDRLDAMQTLLEAAMYFEETA